MIFTNTPESLFTLRIDCELKWLTPGLLGAIAWLDPIQGFADDVIWCLWGGGNETFPGPTQHISLFTSYFIILCFSRFQAAAADRVTISLSLTESYKMFPLFPLIGTSPVGRHTFAFSGISESCVVFKTMIWNLFCHMKGISVFVMEFLEESDLMINHKQQLSLQV